MEWIIHGSYERENSATIVLDSLVLHGILKRESKLFGRRYPIVDASNAYTFYSMCHVQIPSKTLFENDVMNWDVKWGNDRQPFYHVWEMKHLAPFNSENG